MKKLLAVVACFLMISIVHGEDMTDLGKSIIDSFFNLRAELTYLDSADPDSIIERIDRFSDDNADSIIELDAQEKIILENFIIMEKYNYLYELPGQDKVQQKILGEQRQKIEDFRAGRGDSAFDRFFLVTQGDVTSCYMGFSVSDVIKYGKTIRPLYESAIKADENFCYGLMNLGQWYYWAPGIAGGSKDKALTYLERAYKAAETDSQKFYACIFYSQLLFEKNRMEEAQKILGEADALYAGSRYVETVRKANSGGMSIYEYNRKKSKLNDKDRK